MGELTGFPRPDEGPVLVVDPPAQWTRAARAAGWRVQRTPLATRPWRQAGVLVVPASAAGADPAPDPALAADPASDPALAAGADPASDPALAAGADPASDPALAAGADPDPASQTAPAAGSALATASGGPSAAEVLVTTLSRGAGVLLPGPGAPGGLGDDHDVVLADARRLGALVWPGPRPAPVPFGLDAETVRLLDGLARGWHVGAAARAANMSLRTAHRRLRRARESLGAVTTAEAVGRWAKQGRDPACGSAS